jgi:hypothetical protein
LEGNIDEHGFSLRKRPLFYPDRIKAPFTTLSVDHPRKAVRTDARIGELIFRQKFRAVLSLPNRDTLITKNAVARTKSDGQVECRVSVKEAGS